MNHNEFDIEVRPMRRPLTWTFAAPAIALAAMIASSARAEEPKGCGGFKWSLAHEAELLQAQGNPVLVSGASMTDGKAVELKLVDSDAAALPTAPERAPKMKPSQAGFVHDDAVKAGAYQITISQAAWIDVVQDGHNIRPSAFSGATDCPGVRKSIRVTLAARPLTLQISGTQAQSIGLLIAPMP